VFTQSMPALAQALSGALPEEALRQLMQSLGNCQQPLTHRGAINLQQPASTGVGGLARPGAWSPSDYSGFLPTAGQDVFVDIAGDKNYNTNNTNNYGGHQFNFPINQDFTYNNYFGGDTFNVAGDSTFNNTFTNNANTTRLNVEYINNTYVGGDGRDGAAGANGFNGMDGFNGRNGIDGVTRVFFFGGGRQGVRQTKALISEVNVKGSVVVPTVTAATVSSTAVTVGTSQREVTVTVNGTATVPTVKSASVSTIPTGGTFSATPTGIAAAATLGTLAGVVAYKYASGGYLDASCNLVLTYASTTAAVTISGSPAVTISSQGAVSGPVTLTGSTSAPVTLTAGTASVAVPSTGYFFITEPTGAGTLQTAAVTIAASTATKQLILKVNTPRADLITYLRPN